MLGGFIMAGTGKAKHMNIKVDAETGNVLEIIDDSGNKAEMVAPEKLNEIYKSETGFKYIATVLHAHSSPGCVYYISGGWAYRICS
jgi:uncharacterized protein Veg